MSRPLGGDAARLAVATRTATTTATRTAGHLVLMSPVPPKEAVRVASYPEMLMAVRRWLSLPAAIVVLASAGFVALGLQPMPPDVPDRVVSTPFPAMVLRHDNPLRPQRVALGRLLYFDPILSGANDVSCATCHHPGLGLADGRGLSMGKGGHGLGPARVAGAVIHRGAPTVWNAAYNARQFWD